MRKVLQRMGASLVIVGVAMAASCTGSGQGAPAELAGIAAITPLEMDEAAIVPALEDGVGVVEQLDEHRVTIGYLGGPVCRPDYHQQEPGAVAATYESQRVTIAIDPPTRGCDDADAMQFATALEVQLVEPIRDRELVVRRMD